MTRTQTHNPWSRLPETSPYVLPEDAPALFAFNLRAAAKSKYDLSLFPEPYFGLPSAPVVLLALNPGWAEGDAIAHASPVFGSPARLSLVHQLESYPFLHLRPHLSTPGASWWQRIAKPPIKAVGVDAVAKNMCCVQFFPYHSRTFGSTRLSVPSQQYGFGIVRRAVERGADIIVMRSWKLWSAAVPELRGYRNLHFIKNPRNPTLSLANLGNGFNALLVRLRSGA